MQRQITTLNIPFHIRYKLMTAGFLVENDLIGISAQELCARTNLTKEEAELVSLLFGENTTKQLLDVSLNAKSLLEKEAVCPKIVTFSRKIDELLGGGIPLGKVSEICGIPGTGKTQFCLQLCASVQIPLNCGGLGGECVYIDTQGGFFARRMQEIACATVNHFLHVNPEEAKMSLKNFTVQNILSSILYWRCTDYIKLLAAINLLKKLLESKNIKLIVIDSISFPFRSGFDENLAHKMEVLHKVSSQLRMIALKYNVAIVLTNQMTSRFDEQGQVTLIPSLGDYWAQGCAVRLTLIWPTPRHNKCAILSKCSYKAGGNVPFQVTYAGIRDVIIPVNYTETNSSN